MQITLVNYEYPGVTRNCGGGGAVTKSLACGLGDRGHDVSIITDSSDGHYATFPLRTYRRIDRHLETADVDVVHGHFSLPSSVFLPRLAAKHDVPLVVSVMGADVHDPSRFSAIRPIATHLNRRIFEGADAVVSPSRDMQSRVEREFGRESRLVHYGINGQQSTHREPTGQDPIILSVCRLVDRKNLKTAIEAVRQLRMQDVEVQYRIVGTGPNEDHIRAAAGEYPWLSAPGYVADLEEEYREADVFFLPSHHEAFGMVYLEAMSHCLPVVASDVGGQTDFVIEDVSGYVAPPDSPTLQARKLQRALENRVRLGRDAARLVDKRFSQDRMVDDYLGIYQEVAA